MKVAWATDIHLNFLSASRLAGFGEQVALLGSDVFVVTGDIAEAPSLVPLLTDLAASSGQPALFVLGNHDFYRGGIDAVRSQAKSLRPSIGTWLPAAEPIELGEGVVLVGVDGWADARFGDPERTPIRLNDFLLIQDLLVGGHSLLLEKLRQLGDREAEQARSVLDAALELDPEHILFATHIPPFREASTYQGKISDDDWAPFFTCKAVGEVLDQYARAHPKCRFTVLCGHTHGDALVQRLPNLKVLTGGAEYGAPTVQLVDIA